MNKRILFHDKDQIQLLKKKIINSSNDSVKALLNSCQGIDFIKQVKFSQCGFDPLFDEPLNFIEQVNQTCTYLVCLSALDILFDYYPSHNFYINFGTQSGYDIVSENEEIICECFAATSPDSNGKLEKDTKKVFNDSKSIKKYVIYYASSPKPVHEENIKRKYPTVQIVSLKCI